MTRTLTAFQKKAQEEKDRLEKAAEMKAKNDKAAAKKGVPPTPKTAATKEAEMGPPATPETAATKKAETTKKKAIGNAATKKGPAAKAANDNAVTGTGKRKATEGNY